METGRLPIIIDPGMAFGTGHHPTTEGCLVALEKYRGHRVLDVGTGSGILAMAAALAGAEEVIGVDNDPEAIEVAIENLVLNDLVEPVSLLVGQIDDAPEGTYDLVVANIFLNALVSLADQFRKRVSVGGRLIISGLLAAQADDARAAMNAAGFVEIESIPIRGWTTVIFQG
jgi:ribosomal protein L11 methyltransferase